jgi:acetoacetyl-CoA synthetase
MMKNTLINHALWHPCEDAITSSHLWQFSILIQKDYPDLFTNIAHDQYYDILHDLSLKQPEYFLEKLWQFADLPALDSSIKTITPNDDFKKYRFFQGAKLNLCQYILEQYALHHDQSQPALIFQSEDHIERQLSHDDMISETLKIAQFFKAQNITEGMRIAAILPNMPEAITAFLGTAANGGIWTSCSPDFGAAGILDRFGQSAPTILCATPYYYYNGKRIDIHHKLEEIIHALPSLKAIIIMPIDGQKTEDLSHVTIAQYHYNDIIENYDDDFLYQSYDIASPLFIMYSSGTTGKPKCITHSLGGYLLNMIKEHRFNTDLHGNDRLFYFTTLGWMMWNWLVGGLTQGASLMLYDGSPFYPHHNILFDFAEKWQMTQFGTSAKYLDQLRKEEFQPSQDLSALRMMLSTGSPLVEETCHYIYQKIKKDMHLASISGGTDILGCFLAGTATKPVYAGQLQVPTMGMDIQIYNDEGKPCAIGEKGELVCCQAFVNMPICFWGDDDGSRYHKAYFDKFDQIWCHGDFIAQMAEGGYVIYGRSDAVLNPGGVRIGTAEIYRQIEHFKQIKNAVVVGQEWEGDVRVVLCLVMADDCRLDDDLCQEIRQHIRQYCSPRHVPAKIIAVPDIPVTRSGKISELAVRDVIHHREIKNQEALANPEALEYFKNIV